MGIPVGVEFTRLTRNGSIVMSDTPSEMETNYEPVYQAKGSCLLNGLGISLVLKNILLKKEVMEVTVVEVSQDVLDLVSPHYKDDKVTYIHANAMTFKPPKGKRFQMVWHDIWDNICADNLPDMHKLHRKYGRRTDWQGSWCRYECERNR